MGRSSGGSSDSRGIRPDRADGPRRGVTRSGIDPGGGVFEVGAQEWHASENAGQRAGIPRGLLLSSAPHREGRRLERLQLAERHRGTQEMGPYRKSRLSTSAPAANSGDTPARSKPGPHRTRSGGAARDHVGCHASRAMRPRICRKRVNVKWLSAVAPLLDDPGGLLQYGGASRTDVPSRSVDRRKRHG